MPAVILTGDIWTETLGEIARGGHLHLNKPVKGKELTDQIQSRLVESRRSAQASTRKLAEAGGDGPQAPTMFVVEDDRAVREAMRDLLQEDGRTVEMYANSEAFLEAYRSGREG